LTGLPPSTLWLARNGAWITGALSVLLLGVGVGHLVSGVSPDAVVALGNGVVLGGLTAVLAYLEHKRAAEGHALEADRVAAAERVAEDRMAEGDRLIDDWQPKGWSSYKRFIVIEHPKGGTRLVEYDPRRPITDAWATGEPVVRTTHGPIPVAVLRAYPEAFARLIADHPEALNPRYDRV
jgi:hypothetical protein